MLVQHAAVEMRLRFRFARCLEMHLTELFVVSLPERRLRERNAGRYYSNDGE